MHLLSGFTLAQETQAKKNQALKYTHDKYDFSLHVWPEWKPAPLQGYSQRLVRPFALPYFALRQGLSTG